MCENNKRFRQYNNINVFEVENTKTFIRIPGRHQLMPMVDASRNKFLTQFPNDSMA